MAESHLSWLSLNLTHRLCFIEMIVYETSYLRTEAAWLFKT